MSTSSTSTTPVETVFDLLTGEASTTWTLTAPQIEYQWDVPQQAREQNSSPHLYLWGPSEGSLESFSMDGEQMDQSSIVEVSVWTFDADDTNTYKDDVIDILSQYYTDNTTNTTFNTVRPSNIGDHRNEKVARTTDHFVINVQADLGKLRPTG